MALKLLCYLIVIERSQVARELGHAYAALSPGSETDSVEPLERSAALERSTPAVRVIAAAMIVGILWWGQVVLIPIVLSVLISYALEPLVSQLERWHLRRGAAAPLVMVALLSATGLTAYVLRGEAEAFLDRMPSAVHTAARAIQQAARGTPGTVARIQDAARELETAARGATKGRSNDGVTPVRVEEPTFKWSDWLVTGSRSLVQFAAQMLAVVCLTYYLLASGDLYKRKLVRMVPKLTDKKITVQILADIDRQIERVLLARVAISIIAGVAVWMAFRLIGLDNAGVWGVLAAVLFAIPLVGPTVLVMAATAAAFVQFGSVAMAGLVLAATIAVGALEGNLLTPWLMSRAGEMNAVAVFISLLFWGWIWGAWGLLLALPITAATKAVCDRIPALGPFAELLRE